MAVRIHILALFALWATMLQASNSSAHAQYKPFSVNRYSIISFEPGQIKITYSITAGDLPAQRIRQRFDGDRDGQLDQNEALRLTDWARELISLGLSLELDGVNLSIKPSPGQVDLVSHQVEMMAPIWLRFEMNLPCEPGLHKLVYQDRVILPELGQTELFVRPDQGVRLIRVARPMKDRGVVNRMFWEAGARPDAVWLNFETGSPTLASSAPAGQAEVDRRHSKGPEHDGALLKRYLADRDLGLGGLLLALGLAFVMGAFHALSPGHGKTLVAAYLVGSQGTVRHAILLGLIVTFTHVFSVFALGLVALWASEELLPEQLMPWCALVAGTLVFIMGIWMIIRRLRGKDHHGHSHSHKHDHHHDHDHDHDHSPGSQCKEVRMSELLILGISGGMVPCPSAVVVLLFAIYVGRIAMGLGLIGAFSLGLAASLVVVGILVVKARGFLDRFSGSGTLKRCAGYLPWLSATIICIIGAFMTVGAILSL